MRLKTLLKTVFLLCALVVGSSAWADTKTINAGALTNGVLTSSPLTLTFAKNSGSTEPTYNSTAGDLRLYAKGTVVVASTGGNMTQIVFNISTQGLKRLAPITASVGTIATQSSGDETVTWTGNAASVTFTVGDKANYGSDGSSKAGQLCFSSVVITYGSQSTTYTVTYDANGGSGTMTDSNSPYNAGASVTVLANTFTRTDYTFAGWNTAANGSGTNYAAGATFTINANTTLYAQWTANSGGSGNTITLTQSNLGLSGSYTSNTQKTIDGITYVYTDLMKSSNNIQAKASTGTIRNTTAFSGNITSVAITHDVATTANATTISGSADGTNWTQVATGSGSITADFSGRGYKYFKITRGSGAAYWTQIDITIAPAETHTVTFSVNGTTSTATVAEGADIPFPSNIADINGKTLIGWTTSTITGTQATAPSTLVTSTTMGDSDVTYYAVFADAEDTGQTVETKTQTMQYDTWTYSGTTSNQNTYRLFAENSYIESESFDLSKLSKVIVYAGTYGTLSSGKKKVTVTAGGTTWGSATLSTNSATTSNTITSSTSLSGSGNLHIVAGGGDASSNGIRISKVEIYTNEPEIVYSNYCTTVPDPAITLSTSLVEASAAEIDGTINVTYTAIDFINAPEVVWYTDATATTTIDNNNIPTWLQVEITNSKNLYYVIGANTGAARSAYMKVYALDVNGEDVYSELITITQAAATVTATVGAKGYATMVNSEHALDFTGKSISAYIVKSTDGSALVLTKVNKIAKNTPVLLYSTTNSDSQAIPVIADSETMDDVTGNKLVAGTGEAITWTESTKYYVLNTSNTPGFYKANESPVATNKAYLDLTGINASRSFFTFDFDNATSIENVKVNDNLNGEVYDLQGRRVAAPQKGLYIVNGRKVVIK